MVSSLKAIVATLATFSSVAHAWLPTDGSRAITGRDGFSLFGRDGSVSSRSVRDGKDRRWLPANSTAKIRGVNLGALFVLEPWMAGSEWSSMGCNGLSSEWDCVKKLGQTQANKVFQSHWSSWITEDDFDEMLSYGLNTVRIPVGHWMMESSVQSDEYFPQGGLSYLLQVCEWASARGFYIIIDQHGAPGAQVASNADTGHSVTTPGFYTTANYDRGADFLAWLTNLTHTSTQMRNVGSIAVLNEPLAWDNKVASMLTEFYPAAYKAIRDVETTLSVSQNNAVHVQFMNSLWGSGDPSSSLPSGAFSVGYEDHRYIKWDTSVAVTQDAYLKASCTGNRGVESPTIVTEWSLSPPDDVEATAAWSSTTQTQFYADWFAAQATNFEAGTDGWIFWAWKTQLGDYRWAYQDAVAAGVIPKDLDSLGTSTVCSAYT